MTLYAIKGDRTEANHRLVQASLCMAPSLLIDSANCANIHNYSGNELSLFSKVHIIEAESLYRFAPAIRKILFLTDYLKIRNVFITTFTHLFDYDDDEENANVFTDAWRMLAALAKDIDIYIAIESGTIHEGLSRVHKAKEYDKGKQSEKQPGGGNMGHTVMSQRIMTDTIVQELAQFGKALRDEDREVYNRILKEPLKHLGSISYASSMHTWAFLILAALLEQQKKIDCLENELARAVIEQEAGVV